MSVLCRCETAWYTTVITVLYHATSVFGGHGRPDPKDRDDHDGHDDDDDSSSWWLWVIIPVGLIILAIILCVIKRFTVMLAAKKLKKGEEEGRERIGHHGVLTTAPAHGTVVTLYGEPDTTPEEYPGRNMTPPPPYTFNRGEAPPAYDAPYPTLACPRETVGFLGAATSDVRQFQTHGNSAVADPRYEPSAPLAEGPTAPSGPNGDKK